MPGLVLDKDQEESISWTGNPGGQRNTPSATNTEDILLIDDKKQGSSVEVAATPHGEEIEVPANEEIIPHVHEEGNPLEAAGGIDAAAGS